MARVVVMGATRSVVTSWQKTSLAREVCMRMSNAAVVAEGVLKGPCFRHCLRVVLCCHRQDACCPNAVMLPRLRHIQHGDACILLIAG